MDNANGFNGGDFASVASLFLLGSTFCSGIKHDEDSILINDRLCLVDESGKEIDGSGYIVIANTMKENATYKCVRKWDILKNGGRIKSYDTEDEAKAAFNKIVAELTKDKKVIELD